MSQLSVATNTACVSSNKAATACRFTDDGVNRSKLMPNDPWHYPSGHFRYYLVVGRPLRDPSCTEMAQYAARYVS
eukprot:1482297-Pleurochrysis_carterae.AAC.1